MSRRAIAVAIFAVYLHQPNAVAADSSPRLAAGTVVASQSYWDSSRRQIITETTIETEDGPVQVRQLGGSAEGIGMAVIHGPALPTRGARVTATLSEGERPWLLTLHRGIAPPGSSVTDLPRMEFTSTTTTESKVPLRWKSGCAFLRYSAEGTSHLSGDSEFLAMNESILEWMNETRSCGYLELLVEEAEEREVGFDRVNLIKFRENVWGRPVKDSFELYQPEAGGLTTIFFVDDCDSDETPPCLSNSRNGEILDADIELNAVNFAISLDGNTQGGAGCLSDLKNTVTHELGHLMGLDHTCWLEGTVRPVDDQGVPLPSCDSNLSSEIVEATMYNFQDCGETKKATLEADDIAGFCATYPLSADPGTCEPVAEEGGCCTIAGQKSRGGPGGGEALILTLFAALLFAQRRRPL